MMVPSVEENVAAMTLDLFGLGIHMYAKLLKETLHDKMIFWSWKNVIDRLPSFELQLDVAAV